MSMECPLFQHNYSLFQKKGPIIFLNLCWQIRLRPTGHVWSPVLTCICLSVCGHKMSCLSKSGMLASFLAMYVSHNNIQPHKHEELRFFAVYGSYQTKSTHKFQYFMVYRSNNFGTFISNKIRICIKHFCKQRMGEVLSTCHFLFQEGH